jgi:ankyrin repeat protein
MSGNEAQLGLILEQGGNPNATDAVESREAALTALSTAIVWGYEGMAEMLLEAGASVNQSAAGNGVTPLHWAAGISASQRDAGHLTKAAQIDVIQALIAQGANVNARDAAGRTPLFWASEAGAEEAVSVLLDAGALVGIKSNLGTTAAIAALEAGHSDIAAMLRDRGPDEGAPPEVSNTTLAEAILSGDLPAVKTILAENPELAVRQSKRGYTPITLAIIRKQTDIAVFLAKTYPDALAIPGQSGWTPLHFVLNSHKDFELAAPARRNLVQVMAASGAPLEAQTDDGMTPLLLATYNAMPEAVEILLNAGANPDFRSPKGGLTPFMVAATTDLRSMDLLLTAGANPRLQDARGRTALHYLARGSEAMPDGQAASIAQKLIENGAPINVQDNQQETPLMIAARYGHAQMARTLMANGADPMLENNRKETAEYIALVADHYDVIEAIRQIKGAD